MFAQLLKAGLLGILQGITEILPISSTGHLVLTEYVLGVSQEKFGLTFDAAIHLGTSLAVFLFFWPQWKKILSSFWKNLLFTHGVEASRNKILSEELKRSDLAATQGRTLNRIPLFFSHRVWTSYAWFYLLIGTIPAAVMGFFLEDMVETAFRQPKIVAFALILGSLIIFLAEKIGKKEKKMEKINFFSSLIIGFSQSLALLPGISRSGVTIATGMFLGLKRKSAAQFAFLLSGPIVLGAGSKKLFDVIIRFSDGNLLMNELSFFIIGIVAAAIFGWLAIKFLLSYLTCHSMNIFVVYRVLLAVLVLIFL